MTNITQAIPLSIALHAPGLSSIVERRLAPYPRAKKNRNEASIAPIAK